eukprot:PhM_4_TR1772/c0_g1_i1/m.94220
MDTRHEGSQFQVGSVRPGLFDNGCVDPTDNIRPNTAMMVRKLKESKAKGGSSGGGSSSRAIGLSPSYAHTTRSRTTSPHNNTMLSNTSTVAAETREISRDNNNNNINKLNSSTGSLRKLSPARRVEHSITMEGMEKGRMSDPAWPGLRSLENFNVDERHVSGKILLNSPRSVQACVNLGLVPREFLRRSMKDYANDIIRERGPKNDEEVVRMRYKYAEQRRQQKLEAARTERMRLVQLEEREQLTTHSFDGGSSGGEHTTVLGDGTALGNNTTQKAEMVRNEEAKLHKIIAASESRFKQQLLHMEISRSRREEREKKIEQQKERERQRQEEIRMAMVENDRAAEREQAKRAEMRELERRQQEAELEKRQLLYTQKQNAVADRIQQQRLENEEQNRIKRERNELRQKMMQQQAIELQQKKREGFEERWERFQQAQREFRERQEEERLQRREEAEEKQRHISAAIARANLIQENQTRQTLLRELKAEQRIEQFNKMRADELEAKRLKDIEKEVQRQQIFDDAMLLQKERVARLKHKMLISEKHMEDVQQRRERELRDHHENEREKQMDKTDNINRKKRITEKLRQDLLDEIEEKDTRVSRMKEQQADIMDKRRMHRLKVETMRISFQEAKPGPGEYDTATNALAPHSPQWKFGLPVSLQTMRVIDKKSAPPGVVLSPGPAAYGAAGALDRTLHAPPAFTLPKSSRFRDKFKASMDVTPGPGEYSGDV